MAASNRSELLRHILQETLAVGFFVWAFLYVADVIKPGFASNYVSLPGMAALLFVLAIVVASLQPLIPEPAMKQHALSWAVFAVMGVLVIVSFLAAGLSLWLTLFLAFVTLFSLWALRFGQQDTL